MKIMRSVWYLLTFYGAFLPVSWLISGITVYTFHSLFPTYGWGPFMYLFWFKVLTLALTWYVIDQNKKKEYYYYFNLGLSKFLLWSVTLSVDFSLFLILLISLGPLGDGQPDLIPAT